MNPYQVVWELTLRCNMRCSHCGSIAGKIRPNELTTSQAKKVIHQLDELGTESIVFMGGEVFLRKDWFELAKEVNKTNIDLLMISNGYQISQDTIDKLSKLKIVNFGVSIDGGTAKTHDSIRRRPGSFDQCFSFINELNNHNITTNAITSVLKNNIEELHKLRNLLKGKVPYWQLQVGCPVGRLGDSSMISLQQYYQLGEFIQESQDFCRFGYYIFGADNCGYFSGKLYNNGWKGCQAGKRVIGIRSNGDILSCLSINSDSYIEGNVKEKSLVDIWNNPNFAKFNKDINFGSNCSSCFHKVDCGGGCSSMSVALTGIPHNNPYCYHLIEKGDR